MITTKTVKRYFYKGKGYATLSHACRAIAKDELKEEILGPVVELQRDHEGARTFYDDPPYTEYWRGREKLAWLEGDEAKAKIKELYIDRFSYDYCSDPDVELGFHHYEHEQWILGRIKELKQEWKAKL